MELEIDGEFYEVVWSGRDELLPPRLTKPSELWQSAEPDRRPYSKRSEYWTRVCDACGGLAYKCHLFGHVNEGDERCQEQCQ